MIVTALVDTNILVYCWDWGVPQKLAAARETLRSGLAAERLCLPHQAVVEFLSVVTRPRRGGPPLLSLRDAWRETENLLTGFPVLYPNDGVVRTALRGMATYQLSWYDAHLWAYAEHYGVSEILSEDFEDGRLYGTVRVKNPFIEAGLA
jgi:predicted nucleic acid-binding protein